MGARTSATAAAERGHFSAESISKVIKRCHQRFSNSSQQLQKFFAVMRR